MAQPSFSASKTPDRARPIALTPVVASHAVPADSHEAVFDRLASLRRRLREVVDRGDDVDVVTAFAEALLAWDGIEISAYAPDPAGQLVLKVAAGSKRGRPTVQWPRSLNGPAGMLSGFDAQMLGFANTEPLVGVRISTPLADAWLLVCAEGFARPALDRVALYADLLRETLNRLAGHEPRAHRFEALAIHREPALDSAAVQAVNEGMDVALLVLAADDPDDRIHLSTLDDLRLSVRGADIAEVLASREIGVVLRGIHSNDVTRVGQRLCQQALHGPFVGAAYVSFGTAARNAGTAIDVSLLEEARRDRIRRLSDAAGEHG